MVLEWNQSHKNKPFFISRHQVVSAHKTESQRLYNRQFLLDVSVFVFMSKNQLQKVFFKGHGSTQDRWQRKGC